MEDCVKEGLTKNIGLSNFNISQIKDILKQAEIKPAALQVLSGIIALSLIKGY